MTMSRPLQDAEPPGTMTRGVALALIGLIAVTAAAYSSSFGNGFLNWDDPNNVTQNPLITSFAWRHVTAWFTTPLLGMYTPLVYLSFAIDYAVTRLDPRAIPHHQPAAAPAERHACVLRREEAGCGTDGRGWRRRRRHPAWRAR